MLIGLVLLLATATPELDTAQRAYADVDYPRCREHAAAALTAPGALTERVETYRLLGLCSAAVGDTDAARAAFRLMLALDREARLPAGLSPRFTSSYREAKGSWVGVTPLALTLKADVVVDGRRAVTVAIVDEADIVARLAWRTTAGPIAAGPITKSTVELDLTTSADEVTVVALDRAGGEVATLVVPSRSPELGPIPQVAEGPPADDAMAPMFIAGGIGVAVLVLGGVGVAAAFALQPPSTVRLKTDVVFAD